MIFIDLRDREGLLRRLDPDSAAMFAEAERLRGEFVLAVEGRVRERPAGTINPNLPSGEVELLATKLDVLAKAKTPPFHHDEPVSEELRLRYRYLDLRRAEVMRNLRLRHAVTRALRKFMDEHGFVDVETPMLGKTTPRARDHLIPSRTARQLLRASAVAAAHEAAADDRGARPLLSDRQVLPRRRPARGSPARVHAARSKRVVQRPKRTSWR